MLEEKVLSDAIASLLAPVVPGPLLLRREPVSMGWGTAVGVGMGSCFPVHGC